MEYVCDQPAGSGGTANLAIPPSLWRARTVIPALDVGWEVSALSLSSDKSESPSRQASVQKWRHRNEPSYAR